MDHVRREAIESEQMHWHESQHRFESRMRLIFWMYGVVFGVALATIITELTGPG
jgi:hypothetical protein